MPRVPLGRALVGVRRTQHARLVKRPADQLHAERKTVSETDRQAQCGAARHVGERVHVGLRPEIGGAMRVEPRRRTETVREQHVVALVERLHAGNQRAVLARGLHVI